MFFFTTKKNTVFIFYFVCILSYQKKLFQNEENVPKTFKTYSPNLFIALLMHCIVLTIFYDCVVQFLFYSAQFLKIYEHEKKDIFADLFPFLTLRVRNGNFVSFETNVPCIEQILFEKT